MTPREPAERWEAERLHPAAAFAAYSKGRETPDPEDDTRTCFGRDADRIVHSKAFRRLMDKTQVFLMPEGDHYRTRLSHALEVSRIGRTMARALRYNEDLTEAVALGHDLGHTPFGHAGERALNEIVPGGFSHNEQSLRVVTRLEKGGRGLNLCHETRDGILCHTGGIPAATLEGQLIQIADRVAYLSHDMDDAMRGGLLQMEDVPADLRRELGGTPREWINTLVTDVVEQSSEKGIAALSRTRREAMAALRRFMFERVYHNPVAKAEESKVRDLMSRLFEHYLKNLDALPEETLRIAAQDGRERAVCDYIAGMTDHYFEQQCIKAFIPRGWGK